MSNAYKKISKLLLSFATFAVFSTEALAALPTTGTCGFVGNWSYPFAYLNGSSPGNGWGLNFLGSINFSSSTININVILNNPSPLPANPATETQQLFTAAFTTSSGPFAGSNAISFTVAGSSLTWNLLPVNSGNTILVQGGPGQPGAADGGFTGVCQML